MNSHYNYQAKTRMKTDYFRMKKSGIRHAFVSCFLFLHHITLLMTFKCIV